MSFAEWKKRSRFDQLMRNSEVAEQLAHAAFKAGERSGIKKQSIVTQDTNMGSVGYFYGIGKASERCRQIAIKRRSYACEVEHKADIYRAEGAEECADALSQA